MKHFLFILVCPFFLLSQNYSQEFEHLFKTKNYDLAVQKLEAYLNETPQNLELLELMGAEPDCCPVQPYCSWLSESSL